MRNLSSGQALLIILLIMAVALTIGLSIISRSVTDIRISQQTEEAARAYSAAEAGIEEALQSVTVGTLQSPAGFAETGATYRAEVAGFGSGESFVSPQELTSNEIQTVYLADYNPATGALTFHYNQSSIYVCWGGNAAIETVLYYDDTNPKVARWAVDPDGQRRQSNGFSEPDYDWQNRCSNLGFSHIKQLIFPAGPYLFLRMRVLYENTKIGVKAAGSATLPSQGVSIDSTGQAGTATRKVEVVRFHPAPPEIFDFVLYSGVDLKKQ